VNRIHTFIIMFAPSPRKCGECLPVVAARYLPTDTHAQFMYLSPTLEKESQKSVNSTIAHEFAHACLGMPGRSRNQMKELVAFWEAMKRPGA
jgi:hypothetical protein